MQTLTSDFWCDQWYYEVLQPKSKVVSFADLVKGSLVFRYISLTSVSTLAIALLLQFQNEPLLAESAVGFDLVNGQFIVVSVFINQSGPYHFMLDTGSSVTLVDPELIAKLGGAFLGNRQLATPVGSRSVPCFRIDEFRLGSRVAKFLNVLTVPVVSLKGKRVLGLLGQDFLGSFNYVLDYKHKMLLFEENHEFEKNLSSGIFNTYRYAQRVLVMLPPQSSASRPSLFVLDSGAQQLTLFGHQHGGLGFDLKSGCQPGNLYSVVGNQTGLASWIGSFNIGGNAFSDLSVVVSNDPQRTGWFRIENGLLPTSYFQSIYFNNSEGYVSFNPRFTPDISSSGKQ
jgi:hypothetical protein